MRNVILIAAAIVIFLLCGAITVYSNDDVYNTAQELGIDIEAVEDGVPDDVGEKLRENDITPDNTEKIVTVTAGDVIKYIAGEAKNRIKAPIRLLASLVCVIFANAAVNGFGGCLSNKSLEKIYNMVTVLVITAVISGSVSECVAMTSETLNSGAEFMMCYIPVFSGVAASSGSVTSAVAYNTALMLISEAAVWISAQYIMPVLSICMSLGIIEAVNPSIKLSTITQGISGGVKFLLGFIMTIFIGLLSLQSIIGTSADTLGIKAAKYLVSNCVPVIGGAVADAYTTIKSSLGILRGGTGFFGIAAVFFMVMPVIIEIALMRAVFVCSEMVCDMMDFGNIKIIIKNTSGVMSMMLSLVICFSMMLIISTALLMSIGLHNY